MCYDQCKYARADGECMLPEPTGCNCAEGHGDECDCASCREDAMMEYKEAEYMEEYYENRNNNRED